jgi:hypothetical protein
MKDDLSGNRAVSYSTFANYFKPLTALNKVYQLSMNSAQNLEIQLQQENAVIISSSINWSGYNKSYRADNKIVENVKGPADYIVVENEAISSNTYYHGEINYHLYCATNGKRPDGESYYYYFISGPVYQDFFSEADVNLDNQISILEAYYWADPQGSERRISTSDYPNFYNNPSEYPNERSRFISLKYPTLISNNEYAYSEPVPFNICGNIGITNDLVYEDVSLNIQEFSNVTFLNGSSSDSYFIPNINLAQGCVANGETDKFPLNIDNNMTLKGARLENLQLNVYGSLIPHNGTISDCDINLDGQNNIVFNLNSSLTATGNSKITGIFTLPAESKIYVGINSELHLGNGSVFTAESNSTIWLKPYGKLYIDNGAVCNINPGVTVVMAVGSQIISNGTLNGSYSAIPDYQNPDDDIRGILYNGILAGIGSVINLTNCSFTGAETAISGAAASITITNSTFTDCENGISLVECNNYTIENNTLTGVNKGAGIALTQSEGELSGNTISNFSHGIDINLCSPLLSKNKINENKNYGVCIIGYNANPQLIDPTTSQRYLNNEIRDNGTAQIFMKYSASAYMTNGRNNIYSGSAGSIPSVPCIFAGSYTVVPARVAMPSRVDIDSEYNYWGYSDVETYEDSFFDLWTMSTNNGYRLSYQPYATAPYRTENQLPDVSLSAHSQPDPTSILLSNAIKQELSGNLKPSIKLYENVIKRDSTTAEALVAFARLPYVYLKQDLATDPLIKLFDDALADEEETNKKFFKEMKVSTYLKTKKYDEAIAISEEMKSEAQSEGEILLAEIDIAIANMMKNAENSGKSRSVVNPADISDLISRLTGKDEKSEPSFATESLIPATATLFQNYPNPFNPVTQIKFALAKTADVKLSVYNISGQLVSQLTSGVMNAGHHAVDFDGSRFNSGVYYYMLEVDGTNITKKMILTK